MLKPILKNNNLTISPMKKIVVLVFLLLTVTVCLAQGDDYGWRRKYNNFSFINTTMSQDGLPDYKSNYGVSYTVGRTFYLHAPIAGFLRFGIDATWLDLNYTNYKFKHITDWNTTKYQYHQGEISMHIGPSLSLQFGRLNIHGYYRYAPSYSILYANDSLYGNYSTFFVGGAAISYGAIGLGIESRTGGCNYKSIASYGDGDALPVAATYKGLRTYITFRF